MYYNIHVHAGVINAMLLLATVGWSKCIIVIIIIMKLNTIVFKVEIKQNQSM